MQVVVTTANIVTLQKIGGMSLGAGGLRQQGEMFTTAWERCCQQMLIAAIRTVSASHCRVELR